MLERRWVPPEYKSTVSSLKCMRCSRWHHVPVDQPLALVAAMRALLG